MKIIEYMMAKVGGPLSLTRAAEEQFEGSLNILISDGWQPIGGISAVDGQKDGQVYRSLYQAMVKYEDEPTPVIIVDDQPDGS